MLRSYALAMFAVFALSPSAAANERDLRVRSEANAHEISFCARPSPNRFGFPGHAFVAFTKQNGKNRSFIAIGRTTAAGTSAADAVNSYFGDAISGQISEELFSHMKQECLVLRVNSDAYDKAWGQARPRLTGLGLSDAQAARLETYKLGSDDCISFVIDVANTLKPMGLSVSQRQTSDAPLGYITRLVNAN